MCQNRTAFFSNSNPLFQLTESRLQRRLASIGHDLATHWPAANISCGPEVIPGLFTDNSVNGVQ